MKTYQWKTGKRLGVAVAALTLLGVGGCAHRELTAPCSDYKAVSLAAPGVAEVPCDNPLPMARPPWVATLAPPPSEPIG